MTQMQKQIQKLISKGLNFEVVKHPYGGWCVKYPAEKILMNGKVHKYTFWADFREDGTYVHKQSHVTSI